MVGTLKPSIEMFSLPLLPFTPFAPLEGSEDAKAQSWEGAMVGGNKCGRFKGSEDAKVQCWEV